MPILWKELFAIVSAVNLWGHQWAKQKILFHCDNEAVVTIWHKGSTRDSETMALVRLLYFCAARYNTFLVLIILLLTLYLVSSNIAFKLLHQQLI